MAYRIAATANEVEISSLGGATATARPTKDGALILSGRLQVGNASVTITDTRLERVKDDKPDPKKDGAAKVEPLTEEKLKGTWEGKLMNGSIKLDFDPKKVGQKVATAGLILKIGGSVTVTAVGYEIDEAKNEVKFPFAGNATAKPTKDGALMLSGQFNVNGNTYMVPETRVERVKPSEEKK